LAEKGYEVVMLAQVSTESSNPRETAHQRTPFSTTVMTKKRTIFVMLRQQWYQNHGSVNRGMIFKAAENLGEAKNSSEAAVNSDQNTNGQHSQPLHENDNIQSEYESLSYRK
jgi:hypothetical protein